MPETLFEEPRRVEMHKKVKLAQFQPISVPSWADCRQLCSIISKGSEINLLETFHVFTAMNWNIFPFSSTKKQNLLKEQLLIGAP